MTAAMDLARLNRLVKGAVSLIKGMQIVHTEAEFDMAVFSFISWFKVLQPRLSVERLSCALAQSMSLQMCTSMVP